MEHQPHPEAKVVSANDEANPATKPPEANQPPPTKEALQATQAELTQQLTQLQHQLDTAITQGDTETMANIATQAQELTTHIDQLEAGIDSYKTPEQLQAEANLTQFTDYLTAQGLSDGQIQTRLGELEVYYDPATKQAIIARADHQPFALVLAGLQLTGELPLPKQLLISQLHCRSNQLQSLPELPASLTKLGCGHNQLQSLPELPASLTELNCSSNQLQSLPELPASLTSLGCNSNQLQSLPELPVSLTELYCDNNQLTSVAQADIQTQQAKIGFKLTI